MALRNLFKKSTHDLERQGSRVTGIRAKSKFPPYFGCFRSERQQALRYSSQSPIAKAGRSRCSLLPLLFLARGTASKIISCYLIWICMISDCIHLPAWYTSPFKYVYLMYLIPFDAWTVKKHPDMSSECSVNYLKLHPDFTVISLSHLSSNSSLLKITIPPLLFRPPSWSSKARGSPGAGYGAQGISTPGNFWPKPGGF